MTFNPHCEASHNNNVKKTFSTKKRDTIGLVKHFLEFSAKET